MPAALIGATRCARCGHEQSSGDSCGRCAAPWVASASGSTMPDPYGPLTGVVRSSRARRYSAHLLDLITVAVPAGLALVLGRGSLLAPVLWALVAVTALAVVGVQLEALTTRGRTLGRLLMRVRTVDDLTGMPVRLGRLVRRLPPSGGQSQLVTVDLDRGRDPVAIRLDPPAPAAATPGSALAPTAATTPQRSTDQRSRATVGIVLDTGERYEITDALLLGRSPVDSSGSGDRALLAWPDLTRKLAKTHALLEWSGSELWVTDLGSATGTAVIAPGGEHHLLAPGVRFPATIGATVECGGRSVKVVPGG